MERNNNGNSIVGSESFPFKFNDEYAILGMVSAGGNGICYRTKGTDGQYYIIKEYCPNRYSAYLERRGKGLLIKTDTPQELVDEFGHYLNKAIINEEAIGKDLSDAGLTNNPRFFSSYEITPEFESNTRYLRIYTQAGETLKEHINSKYVSQGGKVPLGYALKLLKEIMESAKHIHRKGYLHLDIKLENLYINTVGTIIPIDFGSAIKFGKMDTDDFLMSSSLMGTLGYSSPMMMKVNELKSRLSYYSPGEDQLELNELISQLTGYDDVYSIMQCFLVMLTRKTLHEMREDDPMSSDLDILKMNLEKEENIPQYLTARLVGLFEKYLLLSQDFERNSNVGIEGLSSLKSPLLEESVEGAQAGGLMREIEVMDEILENKGFHPEVVFRNSQTAKEQYFRQRGINPEEDIDEKMMGAIEIIS